jgi:hypothetical protein
MLQSSLNNFGEEKRKKKEKKKIINITITIGFCKFFICKNLISIKSSALVIR